MTYIDLLVTMEEVLARSPLFSATRRLLLDVLEEVHFRVSVSCFHSIIY